MEAITSPVYVVGDNIDTDQIIPAQYLTLVPTIEEEYEKLGSYAMAGLPDSLYPTRFVKEGELKTEYRIMIAGRNYGCGSSREHAPIALGAAGVCAVVAESFARIFFRNCVATGELYPYDSPERLCNLVQTGDVATLDFDADTLTVHGKTYALKPLGEVRPVIDAGGLFNYARESGMIPSGTKRLASDAGQFELLLPQRRHPELAIRRPRTAERDALQQLPAVRLRHLAPRGGHDDLQLPLAPHQQAPAGRHLVEFRHRRLHDEVAEIRPPPSG